MRSLAFALHHYPRTLSKIYLRLGTGFDFYPLERKGLGLAQLAYEPFDRLITAGKTVFTNQVLVNPLRTQPHGHRGLDLGLPGLTKTLPTRRGAGGRNGWLCGRVSL